MRSSKLPNRSLSLVSALVLALSAGAVTLAAPGCDGGGGGGGGSPCDGSLSVDFPPGGGLDSTYRFTCEISSDMTWVNPVTLEEMVWHEGDHLPGAGAEVCSVTYDASNNCTLRCQDLAIAFGDGYYDCSTHVTAMPYLHDASCDTQVYELCTEGDVGGIPSIRCHGTALLGSPSGVGPSGINDPNLLAYWRATQEGQTTQYTAVSMPMDSCGYEILALGDFDPDESCVGWCHDRVADADQNPDDSQQIVMNNCDSFVATPLCQTNASTGSGPQTASLNLSASLLTGSSSTQTALVGQIVYSLPPCDSVMATCSIVIHGVTLDAPNPVQSVWIDAAGGSTPFSLSNLSVSLEHSSAGSFDPQSSSFQLEANSMRLHVAGAYSLGTTSSVVALDVHPRNPQALSGTILSDGSLQLSGYFEVAPGMAVRFENVTSTTTQQ